MRNKGEIINRINALKNGINIAKRLEDYEFSKMFVELDNSIRIDTLEWVLEKVENDD